MTTENGGEKLNPILLQMFGSVSLHSIAAQFPSAPNLNISTVPHQHDAPSKRISFTRQELLDFKYRPECLSFPENFPSFARDLHVKGIFTPFGECLL